MNFNRRVYADEEEVGSLCLIAIRAQYKNVRSRKNLSVSKGEGGKENRNIIVCVVNHNFQKYIPYPSFVLLFVFVQRGSCVLKIVPFSTATAF